VESLEAVHAVVASPLSCDTSASFLRNGYSVRVGKIVGNSQFSGAGKGFALRPRKRLVQFVYAREQMRERWALASGCSPLDAGRHASRHGYRGARRWYLEHELIAIALRIKTKLHL